MGDGTVARAVGGHVVAHLRGRGDGHADDEDHQQEIGDSLGPAHAGDTRRARMVAT